MAVVNDFNIRVLSLKVTGNMAERPKKTVAHWDMTPLDPIWAGEHVGKIAPGGKPMKVLAIN